MSEKIVVANPVLDAFDAFMDGAAAMLDIVGKIEFTYDTKSGNTVHCVLDSP